jgi:4-amino-4-deoxy-L-arabinose transferase-like glycosyltransferase
MTLSSSIKQKIWLILLITLAVRLIAMWLIPLTDTTEARYGEIARKMVETNNWVTPLHNYDTDLATCSKIACVKLANHDYGIPFWAKPPLSTWVAAISMKAFGINEFAARLPSLLFCLGILAIFYHWLKARGNELSLVTVTVLGTSFLYCGASALVMTDLALIFCSALAMVSFWQAVVENQGKAWGYLFFFALGLGLLAKGPLILVLVGLPTGLWTLVHFQLLNVWKRLPWITGILVAAVIAGPWYYLAEKSTPGFIQYFIVGEHFSRFMISGWQGDHYGHAHSEPLGMIWLYLLGGFMPWIGLVLVLLVIRRKLISWRYPIANPWISYLLLWSIMPVIFFTFAHNIIPPYALPSMPAMGILFAECFVRLNVKDNKFCSKTFIALATLMPVVFIVVIGLYTAGSESITKSSEKELASRYLELRPNDTSKLLYYADRYYSAEFYTLGKARSTDNMAEFRDLTSNNSQDFIAIKQSTLSAELNDIIAAHFHKVAEFHRISLYQECATSAPCQN